MSARKIRVGSWELRHHILRPSRCLLQTHTLRLQKAITPPQDPIITFRLTAHPPTPHSPPKDDTPRTVAIHRCLLRAARGPLEALVTSPFAESEMSEIVIHETFECFDVVRKFLYCEPIHMLNLPPDLPLVADRWGLSTLFEACFTHAEERAHAHAGVPKLSVAELIIRYVPIMAIVDVPDRFKTYLALRLGTEIKTVDAYFKKHPVTPTSVDDICCVEHDNSVTCRRRRASVCAGKDQRPCTTIENASAQSASVVCMSELVEHCPEKEALPDINGDTKKPDEQEQLPAGSVSAITASMPSPSVDHTSGEVREESSTSLEHPESSTKDPSSPEASSTIEESSSGGRDSNRRDVDGTAVKCGTSGTNLGTVIPHSTNAGAIDVGEMEAGGTEPDGTVAVGACAASVDSREVAITNGDAVDADSEDAIGEAEDENDPTCVESNTDSPVADPPPTDAVSAPSDIAEQTAPSEDVSALEGSISDMSVSQDDAKEDTEGSVAETEKSEIESDDIATSEAPQRADWHDNFNVWRVFQSRNMLDEVIHYLSHYGPGDYTPLILDVVLRILEPKTCDDEITRLLREIDWDWENPSSRTLNSKSSEAWSARAWRLLACARVGFTGSGSDIRMSWNYSDLFRDMHDRATELANRSNNGSDSDSSHSSVDDDTDFTVDWDGKAGDEHFEFSMSLVCDCMALDHLSQLNLRIRLLEKDDAPLDKQTGRREVTARIKVIESGCGCDLPYGPSEQSHQGFTASPVKTADSRMTLWQYRDSGVNYKIMLSDELGSWIKRHRKQCGLVFQVRLYVYPLEEDEDDKKKQSRKDEESNNDCTCGFCECVACSLEDGSEDENQESN